MQIFSNYSHLVMKPCQSISSEPTVIANHQYSFQSGQPYSGGSSQGDEHFSSLKFLTGIKILTDGLLVGGLNCFIFKIPAVYAIGTEVCMATLESLAIAGLTIPKSPLAQKVNNISRQLRDKAQPNESISNKQSNLALTSGLVTFAGDALVTGISFLKAKGKTQTDSPLTRFPLIKNSKVLQALCEKSSFLIGASLLGSLIVGYLEGVVSKHLADSLECSKKQTQYL